MTLDEVASLFLGMPVHRQRLASLQPEFAEEGGGAVDQGLPFDSVHCLAVSILACFAYLATLHLVKFPSCQFLSCLAFPLPTSLLAQRHLAARLGAFDGAEDHREAADVVVAFALWPGAALRPMAHHG